MKEIFVHIGHGGTGTSFLQSVFADQNAIAYPEIHGTLKRVRAGAISTGNVGRKFDLRKLLRRDEDRILVSSEGLFGRLGEDMSDLSALCLDSKVKVLLAIRDPLDHMITSYGQFVKLGRTSESVDAFAARYRVPKTVGNRIEAIMECNCDLTVINYSRHSHELLGCVEDWLGVSGLKATERARVNRSLTSSEISAMRQVIDLIGVDAKRIGDKLCRLLPDIERDRVRMDEHSIMDFVARMRPMIASTNRLLSEKEQYEIQDDLSGYIGTDGDSISMRPEQFSIFADELARYEKKTSNRS